MLALPSAGLLAESGKQFPLLVLHLALGLPKVLAYCVCRGSREGSALKVMNSNIEPTIEYGGTCKTYFMIPKESMRTETEGSYLELVSEFEIAAGHYLELDLHRCCSGQVLMLSGPLFEGHG